MLKALLETEQRLLVEYKRLEQLRAATLLPSLYATVDALTATLTALAEPIGALRAHPRWGVHRRVRTGHCIVCGHHGTDCTGTLASTD